MQTVTSQYMKGIEIEEKQKIEKWFYLPQKDVIVSLVADFESGTMFFDMAYEDLMTLSEGTGECGLDGEEMIYLGEG